VTTLINIRNTFRIKYLKNIFLNPDFCNLLAQFDKCESGTKLPENTTKFGTVRKKMCRQNSEQSGTKSLVKPTCSEKTAILSTFLEFSLNFLFNNLRNTTKFGTVRKKSGVKI